MVIPRLFNGGYEWSTVSESDFLRIGSAGGGSGVAGAFGLRANEDVEELDRDTDLREVYDAFLGGSGGATF